MIRIGTPSDIDAYFSADDGWIISELHKAGCQPMWKDGSTVYFKKNNKLLKVLKKLEVEVD